MQAGNIWNKYYLHCAKVILLIIILSVGKLHAQTLRGRTNNPGYDTRKLSYGFLIGLHSSAFQVKYSNAFVTPDLDTLHSVEPDKRGGFSLGFIVNYRAAEFLDLRVTPTVAFYEHLLRYRYTNRTFKDELVETTMVELPILLKYKSDRRGNIRAYMIGGVKPAIEASGKKAEENISKGLEVKGFDLSLEAGIGLDLYFPLFKFSPELRFSRGIMDVLDNRENNFGKPLKYVNTNTVTLILLFQ
jgi:hypothetical protein